MKGRGLKSPRLFDMKGLRVALKPMNLELRPRKETRIEENTRREILRPKKNSVSQDDGDIEYCSLLGLDPGGTTGWSLISVLPEAISPAYPMVKVAENTVSWTHGQVDCGTKKGNLGDSLHKGISTEGENLGISEIVALERNWPLCAVVIEDFILDPGRFNMGRDLLSPVRLTSAIAFDLWLQKRYYFTQTAALAKTTVTDARLRSWGYYNNVGGLQHARDADRHVLTFLRRCQDPSPNGRHLREQAWPRFFGKNAPFSETGKRKNA